MKLFVRILLCIINVLLALALLACLATKFINPSSFVNFELLALGFPVIFLFNVAALIFWICTKDHKKYCLLSLIVILLSLPMCCKYYSFKTKKEPETTSHAKLKIMSYNVMGFMYQTWRKSTEVKQQIFLYITKENPDVICFQEYHNDTKEEFIVLDSLKQQLNLSYVHHNRIFSTGKNHFQGNLICSRYPIIATGNMDFEKKGNATIWADILVENDTIRIYNSHLESYRLSVENKETVNAIGSPKDIEIEDVESLVTRLRNSMVKRGHQVDEIVKSMEECPYPIISCGDFNSPPCSHSYQAIQASQNFKDAFLECGKGTGATFNWWPQLRLDYILFDPKFECNNYKRTGLKASDHFPISCEIDILPKE